MATIKDIAAKAGVSRGTVDRVLHDRGRVDAEVAERIRTIAKELNYRPNAVGQALAATCKGKRMGVILPSLSNPFFKEIKKGMEKAAEKENINLFFSYYSNYSEAECRKATEETLEKEVDTILATLPDMPSLIKDLEESGLPFASVNTGLSSSSCLFYSGPDYGQKGRINAGLLAITAPFPPRIMVLRGSGHMKGHREILEGFENALKERGIEYSIVADLDTDDDDNKTFELTQKALQEDAGINTVFISTAGAGGAMKAIGNRKLLVFSSDEGEAVKKGLEDGLIKWTISQEPFFQGYNAVKKMSKYIISGERPEDFISRNVVKIKENIGEELCL